MGPAFRWVGVGCEGAGGGPHSLGEKARSLWIEHVLGVVQEHVVEWVLGCVRCVYVCARKFVFVCRYTCAHVERGGILWVTMVGLAAARGIRLLPSFFLRVGEGCCRLRSLWMVWLRPSDHEKVATSRQYSSTLWCKT